MITPGAVARTSLVAALLSGAAVPYCAAPAVAQTAPAAPQAATPARPQGIVPTVRAAIAKQDFAGGEQLIAEYRKDKGVTPEMVEAVSWLGRGALAAKQYDKATSYANQTYDLVKGLLKSRGLDDEPHLPIAFGAAIEVLAQARAATGGRSGLRGRSAALHASARRQGFAIRALQRRLRAAGPDGVAACLGRRPGHGAQFPAGGAQRVASVEIARSCGRRGPPRIGLRTRLTR